MIAKHSPLAMGVVATTPTSSHVPVRVIDNWNQDVHTDAFKHPPSHLLLHTGGMALYDTPMLL